MRNDAPRCAARRLWRETVKYLALVLVIAIGIAAVVAGEADDSPGLQLLGGLLVIGAVALAARIVSAQALPDLTADSSRDAAAGRRSGSRHRCIPAPRTRVTA